MMSIDLTTAQYEYLCSAEFLPADLRQAVAERSSESPWAIRITMLLEDVVGQFNFDVRGSTIFSGPLQQLIDSGAINRVTALGA